MGRRHDACFPEVVQNRSKCRIAIGSDVPTGRCWSVEMPPDLMARSVIMRVKEFEMVLAGEQVWSIGKITPISRNRTYTTTTTGTIDVMVRCKFRHLYRFALI